MTAKRTAKTSQHVEWLTPDPVTGVQPVFADAGGPWHVTPHWALVDGRAMIVGLDIRSFDEPWVADSIHPDGGYSGPRQPVDPRHGLAEITQHVIRSVSISEVRQESRAYLAEKMRQHAEALAAAAPSVPVSTRMAQVAGQLTAKGEPRKRQPPASRPLLTRVAELYLVAVAQSSTTPVREVEEQLRAEGVAVSARGGRAQVRKWVQRARREGLIPPVPPVGQHKMI